MNETLEAFDYSQRVIAETDNWAVLLRAKQVTLGSMVLIEKSNATSLADISAQSAQELPRVISAIEQSLQVLWQPEKVNYLALMMVDPNVHFHVIPRYASQKSVSGVTYDDTLFPKPPELTKTLAVNDSQLDAIQALLIEEVVPILRRSTYGA